MQGLLALLFLFSGGMKLVAPPESLQGPVALPLWFMRFIGVCEVLGGIGLVLPQLVRIQPWLTPLAAAGLVVIMLGATVVTLVGGMVPVAVIPLVTGLLCAFVAYGRSRPAASRASLQRPPLEAAR